MFWSVRHNHRSFPLAVWQCVLQRASSAKSKRQPDARSVSVTQEDLKPDWPDSYGKRPLCFYRVMPEERVGVSAFAVRRSPFAVRRSPFTPIRRYAGTPIRCSSPDILPHRPDIFVYPGKSVFPCATPPICPFPNRTGMSFTHPMRKRPGTAGCEKPPG